jgi:hypothetical protein
VGAIASSDPICLGASGHFRRLEFFASQFEFGCHAATQFEYKTKETIRFDLSQHK